MLRVLRRRWVLAAIFVCCLLYFISSIIQQRQVHVPVDYEINRPINQEAFQWKPRVVDNDNSSQSVNCRNSVQGKTLIVDERGYVCLREDLKPSGCCNSLQAATKRFACDSCLDNGCCSVYENCVSCCLQPDKQTLLRRILAQAGESFNHLFASVQDHFELCLAKCRTSSQSVQHENSYRDPEAKYCYGESPPDLQALVA